MSRRPRIQSRHERQVEERIQSGRRKRDAAMRAAGRRAPAGYEPYISCVGRGPVKGEIPPAVQAWIKEETREQLQHYRAIQKEMAALTPLRDRWVEEFFDRITGPRGFSVHAGTRATIPRDQIPARPLRPWRVVW